MASKETKASAPAAPEVQEHPAPGKEVAQYDAGGGVVGRAVFGGVEDISLSLWSSLPMTRRAEVIRLLQGQTDSLSEKIGEVIRVEHVLAHRVEMVDQDTGEVTEGDRIVVVTPEGESFAAVSVGIRKSLSLIMALYGTPPWKGGLPLRMRQINTRRKFRTFALEPVDEK